MIDDVLFYYNCLQHRSTCMKVNEGSLTSMIKKIYFWIFVSIIYHQRLAVAILGALSHALDPGLDLGSNLGKHVRVAVEAVHPDCRVPDYNNWALDTFYTNVHLPFSSRLSGLPESPPLVPWCEALSPVVQRCRVLTLDSAGDTR